MRVSAGLLPNMTTRSECASASEKELAFTLSYGLNLVAFFPNVLWRPVFGSAILLALPYI